MERRQVHFESLCMNIVTDLAFLCVGREIKSEIGAYFLKDKSSPTRMPRADVAKFMIDCLPKSDLFQKAVAVGL